MVLVLKGSSREKAGRRLAHIDFNGLIENTIREKQGAGVWLPTATYGPCVR
jgi:hypothetical protein